MEDMKEDITKNRKAWCELVEDIPNSGIKDGARRRKTEGEVGSAAVEEEMWQEQKKKGKNKKGGEGDMRNVSGNFVCLE